MPARTASSTMERAAAAHANQHIHAPLRRHSGPPGGAGSSAAWPSSSISPSTAIRRRGGRGAQHVQHGAHGLGIGVIAIVPDDDAVALQVRSPRILPMVKRGDGLAQALRRDLEGARHGDGGQQVDARRGGPPAGVSKSTPSARKREPSGRTATSSARTSAPSEKPNVIERPG